MRLRLVIAAATVLALAACGDDETVTTRPGAPTTAATTAPGSSGPLGSGPYPVADLTVRTYHPERELVYAITCLGDTATVTPVAGDEPEVDERAACLALSEPAVVERLVQGPPEDQVCAEVYGGPDTAEITGTIDDQPVTAKITREDACGISTWDDLLAPILPPAIGVT